MSQEEYLKRLSKNVRKHREIDAFLVPIIKKNLPKILELRGRFLKRNGALPSGSISPLMIVRAQRKNWLSSRPR
jgi:hypothetical protein